MLQVTVDWLLYSLLKLSPESGLGKSLNFFVYDSIKIIALLFLMIFLMGVIRTYIPQERIRRWLSGRKKGAGNVLASVLGAATPFCSCSSIPIFLGFMEAGIPLGVAMSFLITSPVVNEYLVVLMFGFFGWKITAAYIASGMLIGIVAGFILGEMGLEKHLEKGLVSETTKQKRMKKFSDRIHFGLEEAGSILKKLWIWILVGVGIGAVIHNFVPEEAIKSIISKGGIFGVPIAALVGVPIYGSCAAIVPIAAALFGKGVPIGTALSFMMAVSALSFPEAVIFRRAMKLKMIAIFFGVVSAAIIITGYLFNILEKFLV